MLSEGITFCYLVFEDLGRCSPNLISAKTGISSSVVIIYAGLVKYVDEGYKLSDIPLIFHIWPSRLVVRRKRRGRNLITAKTGMSSDPNEIQT